MLDEQGHLLPHGWIADDDEMGKTAAFRRDLNDRNERYMLAVPSNTAIRDLEAAPPPYGGRGSRNKTPFVQAHSWRDQVDADQWTRINVRDAEKGPLEVEVVACRVQTKIKRRLMQYEEMLVIIRSLDEQGATKYDYYLSNAPSNTPVQDFARVALAENRIEEAIKRGKSQAGLSDYEVRNWRGWHHHQALSLIATWFLASESRRGKKYTPAITVPQIRDGIAMLLRAACDCNTPTQIARNKTRRLIRNEQARFYHHKARNRLPPTRLKQRR